MSGRSAKLLPALLLALIAVLGTVIVLPLSTGATQGPAARAELGHVARGLPVGTSAAAGVRPLGGSGSHATPSCTPVNPTYVWVQPTGTSPAIGPPLPQAYYQSPCTLSDPLPNSGPWHDEVHVTYATPQAGSGSRVSVPIIPPSTSGSQSPGSWMTDFGVGMVVTGDTASVDNQSYAMIYFYPNGTSYIVQAEVWSLRFTPFGQTCPASMGLNFTWNNSYACEQDILNGGAAITLASSLAGGSLVNVTFVGLPRSTTSPLTIYVNDSSASLAKSVVLDSSTTGGLTLSPDFNSSCLDFCTLNWSQTPMGLGFTADLCYYSGCDSYDYTNTAAQLPVTLLPPKFWVPSGSSGAYSGQYRLIAPGAASGVCGGTTPWNCPAGSYSGFYPDFTFNGSYLNFGAEPAWASENFGGATVQFSSAGTTQDIVPLFVDRVANDSHAGFATTSSPINVTARAQVFGNMSRVNVSYTLPNGQVGNESMSRVNGTTSNGSWYGLIPATGGNGLVTFRVWATDLGGAVATEPGGLYRVWRVTSIPRFTVDLSLNAPGCGAVVLNGTSYSAATPVTLEAGRYPLASELCYPYVFGAWKATGGAEPVGSTRANLTLSANGTLEAVWSYVRPLDTVILGFVGEGCSSSITLNGSIYTGSASVKLLNWKNFSLTESACSGYGFSGWRISNFGNPSLGTNLSILGTNLLVLGNATLQATYVPTATAVDLTFLIVPPTCGAGILFEGAGYTSGTQLYVTPGQGYPIAQDPCAHYGFSSFSTTTGVTIAGGTVTLSQSGTVTENLYHLTEVTVLTHPSFCGGVYFDGVFTPNGVVLNLTNNTVHTVTPENCSGYYFTGFNATGGLFLNGNTLTVNGSGTLNVNFQKGTPTTFVGFETNPSNCGGVLFDGVVYGNTRYAYVAPFTEVTVGGVPCAGFGFVAWATTGGITIVGSTAYVNASGSIKAIFHALSTVLLFTKPSACGSILLGGVRYSNGATATVPVEDAIPLSALPCAGFGFSQWLNTSDGLIDNGHLTLLAETFLTAVFVPLHYAINVSVLPATCGGLGIAGTEFFNNQSTELLAGQYALTPEPCPGFFPVAWNLTGGLTENNGTLVVNGSGNLSVLYGPVPPSVVLSAPASSYTGAEVPFVANVAVLVPPYSYTYTWVFGDGSSETTPGNQTAHAYDHPGVYRVSLTVHDPFGRTAQANVTVAITVPALASNFTVSTVDGGLLAAIAAVLVAIVLLSRRRRRPRAPPPEASELTAPFPDAIALDEGGAKAQDEAPFMLDAPPTEPSIPPEEPYEAP
jgi:hypothetical protein